MNSRRRLVSSDTGRYRSGCAGLSVRVIGPGSDRPESRRAGVSLGLLRREPRAGRREVGLHVTAAGARRLQIALRARADAVQALVAPLPPAERRQLAELTGKALRSGTRRRDEADITGAGFCSALHRAGPGRTDAAPGPDPRPGRLPAAGGALRPRRPQAGTRMAALRGARRWRRALSGTANLLFLAATGRGPLAVVAVLTALCPGITVLLARAVLAERWTRLQAVGLSRRSPSHSPDQRRLRRLAVRPGRNSPPAPLLHAHGHTPSGSKRTRPARRHSQPPRRIVAEPAHAASRTTRNSTLATSAEHLTGTQLHRWRT